MLRHTVAAWGVEVQRWARIPVAFGGGGGRLDEVTMKDVAGDVQPDGRHIVNYAGGGWSHTYWLHHEGDAVVISGTSDRHPHIVRAVVTGLREEDIVVTVERGARDLEE